MNDPSVIMNYNEFGDNTVDTPSTTETTTTPVSNDVATGNKTESSTGTATPRKTFRDVYAEKSGKSPSGTAAKPDPNSSKGSAKPAADLSANPKNPDSLSASPEDDKSAKKDKTASGRIDALTREKYEMRRTHAEDKAVWAKEREILMRELNRYKGAAKLDQFQEQLAHKDIELEVLKFNQGLDSELNKQFEQEEREESISSLMVQIEGEARAEVSRWGSKLVSYNELIEAAIEDSRPIAEIAAEMANARIAASNAYAKPVAPATAVRRGAVSTSSPNPSAYHGVEGKARFFREFYAKNGQN